MLNYIIRRLLLMVPTLFGILLVAFTVIQFAPGGPVERMIAQLTGQDDGGMSRLGGGGGDSGAMEGAGKYRGSQGLDPELIKELEERFGFDKPPVERFFSMVWDYLRFDFGNSYYRDIKVIDLILEKLPVTLSLGMWSVLIIYFVSIPLGIRKAVREGSAFDVWTSAVIVIAYAIPGFLFAILLIILFAGGSFLDIFPLRGLGSDNWDELSFFEQILDYLWHAILPVISLVIAGFATITFLTRNSFLEEINKQYVMTARAKGLSETRVLNGHVFRNAILVVISGFPGVIMAKFFTGSLLIETIFNLDGLGLLAYESIVNRDYAVVFASLYIFSLIGMMVTLVTDIVYTVVDPRIDFEAREV